MTAVSKALGFSFLLALGGCIETGTGAGYVTGAAGGETSIGANGAVARCPETLGTLAIDDGRQESWWGPFISATHITTIEPLVRLVVQQSNCFTITSVGNVDLENRMNRITSIQRNGEFRAGSNQQRGQRVAADYFLQPAILFASAPTGGIGGGLGAFVPGRYGGLVSGLAGGMSQSSTSVTMSLFNIRAGVQMAESEGSSSATNFGAVLAGFGGGFGGGGGGSLGAYRATPAGQATVAAFVDAYNKLVYAIANYKEQNIRGGAGTGGRMRVQGQ